MKPKLRRKKTATDLDSPRRSGKEKGTILWRVQLDYGDMVVKENPESGDMTFADAIKAARPGARVFVRGSHSWPGILKMDKNIQIVGAGAWVTTLTGRWCLEEYQCARKDDKHGHVHLEVLTTYYVHDHYR